MIFISFILSVFFFHFTRSLLVQLNNQSSNTGCDVSLYISIVDSAIHEVLQFYFPFCLLSLVLYLSFESLSINSNITTLFCFAFASKFFWYWVTADSWTISVNHSLVSLDIDIPQRDSSCQPMIVRFALKNAQHPEIFMQN